MNPAPAGLTVGCARLRNGAAGDRERLVAVLGQAPLPEQGLLWIARLKVRTPMRRGADNGAFVREVGEALQGAEAGAHRPGATGWGHGEALFFENDASLAATLIAQWLCGAPPAARSWWPHFTGGASPQQWWRAAIVPDARLMPRVVDKLSAQGLGSGWLAALDDAAVEAGLGALASAYGFSVGQPATRPAYEAAGAWPTADLVSLGREVAMSGLAERRRLLLGAALLAQRAPAILAGPRAEAALAALAACPVAELPPGPPSAADGAARIPTAPDGEDGPLPRAASDRDAGPRPPFSLASPAAAGPPPTQPLIKLAAAPRAARDGAEATPSARRRAATTAARASVARTGVEPVSLVTHEGVAEPRGDFASAEIADGRRIATGYAGLLFVINAFLALGLYGDFASPRRSALAISPWALLRRLGCRWLGRGFERDPLHRLLTELAGCPAGDCLQDLDPPIWPLPGQDALSRSEGADSWDGWLDGFAPYLQVRLAAALGRRSGRAAVGALCRRPGTLLVTDERLTAHMALDAHPLAVRVAGLDRDPGWVPAAGRIVEFVFE